MSDTEVKKAPRKASANKKTDKAVDYKELVKLLENHMKELRADLNYASSRSAELLLKLEAKDKAISQLKGELHNTVAEMNKMRGYIARIYEEEAEPEIQTTRQPPRREYAGEEQVTFYDARGGSGRYGTEEKKKAWWDL